MTNIDHIMNLKTGDEQPISSLAKHHHHALAGDQKQPVCNAREDHFTVEANQVIFQKTSLI